jgi:hypothetical protein
MEGFGAGSEIDRRRLLQRGPPAYAGVALASIARALPAGVWHTAPGLGGLPRRPVLLLA